MPDYTSEILNAQVQFDNFAFKNDLPIPPTIDRTKGGSVTLQMRQTEANMGIFLLDENANPVLDQKGEPIPLHTTVWGYGVGNTSSYLGPTILAKSGAPITVTWLNKLPTSGHLLDVDYTLHRAMPYRKLIEDGYVPVVPHLHGGETDPDFDGYPTAWYTQTQGPPGPAEVGPQYSTNRYTYDNEQVAAPLWYHDHALGLTRLNVYAGLAGVYKLTDVWKLALQDGVVTNSGDPEDLEDDTYVDLPDNEIPLVVQDKAYTTDGELYYPAKEGDVLPDGAGGSGSVGEEAGNFFDDPANEGQASALPEFFGDHILVNGMAWPNLDVGAGGYTFNLLNGSDSRFYVYDFVEVDENGAVVDVDPNIKILAIAGDGGLLPFATDVSDGFVMAPGDRLDVVVDFSGLFMDGAPLLEPGHHIRLINTGPDYSPFKAFNTPEVISSGLYDATAADIEDSIGNVMQFTLDASVKAEDISVNDGDSLWPEDDPDYISLLTYEQASDLPTRKVGLFEGADEYGRVQPLLGTAKAGAFHSDKATPDGQFGPLLWGYKDENDTHQDVPITEVIELGSTERWEVYNFTADAHPIHLHLTQYQALGRREIQFHDGTKDGAYGEEDGVPDDTDGVSGISYGRYDTEGDIDFSEHDVWVSNFLREMPAEEGGRQDTVYVPSGPRDEGKDGANIGDMLELAATFNKEGLFVWHCHILSHEDHEMMRPFYVKAEPDGAQFLDDSTDIPLPVDAWDFIA